MLIMLRFQSKTGGDINLQEQGKVACSSQEIYNPLLFGNRPLSANETFLFDTLCNDSKKTGYLRCGVTLHNPKTTALPKVFLPSLINLDKSWVFTVFPQVESPLQNHEKDSSTKNIQVRKITECVTKWSRVALHVTSGGELYINLDNVQYGPLAHNIPVGSRNIYVIVYSTQRIRIIDEWGKFQLICT